MLYENPVTILRASPGGSAVKNPPAVQETQFWFLGREDPLEGEMATHSSVLAWKMPWTDELAGATVHGVAQSQTRLSTHDCM